MVGLLEDVLLLRRLVLLRPVVLGQRGAELLGNVLVLFGEIAIWLGQLVKVDYVLLVDCFHRLVALDRYGLLLLMIGELVLVLLLSLALSLTLPLASLELPLHRLGLSVFFCLLHVCVLLVSALCVLAVNVALIAHASI